jgi:DUF4097 and DUF4098 domain-containing protein YvlB
MVQTFRGFLFAILIAAPADAQVTDRFDRTVPVASTTAISVQVTIGDIRITAWDRADVSIEIVRRAPNTLQLQRIPAVVEETGDGLAIRAAQSDGGREATLRADIVLRVPAAANLRDVAVFEGEIEMTGLRGSLSARVERGDIVAKQVSGSIRFETSMGNIRLDGATLSADGMMRLRTFNGNVALALASRPENARIMALSMGGTITSDIPLTLKERFGPRFGEATLGTGEPPISIDVVNGNVAITVAGAGR